MSFAPHTNDDVRHQHLAGMNPTPAPLLLGTFRHKQFDGCFEYAERRWFCERVQPDFPHIIYVKDGTRLAHVKQTVAYVLVDNDLDGKPVIEKWPLKQHRHYTRDWVYA